MNIRTRALRRFNSRNKAIRKKRISDSFMGMSSNGERYHWYKYLHQYDKGKIHCSCPLCRRKTKSKHRGLTWEGSGRYDFKISELKQQQRLDSELSDWSNNN